MNRTWWGAPILLLCCCVGWIYFTGIKGKREYDDFNEIKKVNLGVLNASEAENRLRALRALVDILGPGARYGVSWQTEKTGKRINYEFSVGSIGRGVLVYCEISSKSMECFAFYNLKPDTLSKIANNKQSKTDPLKQLEEQGYKKQRM